MKLEVWAHTDIGLRREINQDSILVDKELNLFVVADGMGGHKGGEVASAMAVETLREVLKEKISAPGFKPKDALQMAFREASARIHQKSTVDSPELMGMGTTLVGILSYKDKFYIANVGDSRAYLYSEGQLWQLTEDHSLINEQVRAGVLTAEEAPLVIGRNVITRSIGFEREVQVDILERKIQAGEVYLLCSDGLSSLVIDEDIQEIIRKSAPQDAVTKCIQAAKNAGGDDNVSVIIVKVSG